MKTKYFSMYGNAVDKNGLTHVVTILGELTKTSEVNTHIEETKLVCEDGTPTNKVATVITPYRQLKRTLKLSFSICNPEDTFNEEVGKAVAKRRIKHGDIIGSVTSNNITMLNDDQCNWILFGELKYVTQNIDKYLPENTTDTVEEVNDTVEDDNVDATDKEETDNVETENEVEATEEDGLNDGWDDMEKYKISDNEYDLTNATNDEIAKLRGIKDIVDIGDNKEVKYYAGGEEVKDSADEEVKDEDDIFKTVLSRLYDSEEEGRKLVDEIHKLKEEFNDKTKDPFLKLLFNNPFIK